MTNHPVDGNTQPLYRPIPGWSPSTPEVTDSTINEVVQRHPAVAIHFWAAWNGVDPPMDRVIQEIGPRFAGRLVFYSCNTDLAENVELCRRFRFGNIPALSVLVAGQPHKPIIGLRSPDDLVAQIETRLRKCAAACRLE